MSERYNLEDKLKDLKLTKRSFLLEGKDTNSVDSQIKLVEDQIKNNININNKKTK